MNLHTLFHYLVSRANAGEMINRTEHIWKNNQWSDMDGYIRSANFVREIFQQNGLETRTTDLSFDGTTVIGDIRLPLGWNGRSARLEMQSPLSRVLADRQNSPYLLGPWSPSTPDEGWQGEVVCLEKGEAYELEGQPVQDRLILTPGRVDAIRKRAIEKKAAGILTCYAPYPDMENETTTITPVAASPGGWGIYSEEDAILTMALTPAQGKEIQRLTHEGNLTLRVHVSADFSPMQIPILDTTIEGAFPEEEIWLAAPLYGPGANYPAVNAAVLVESALLLHQGIQEESLPQPMRTIRFILGPRQFGLSAFASFHPDEAKQALNALYLEGGAGNPDLSWARWTFRTSPSPLRSYSSVLTQRLCKEFLNAWRPQRNLDPQPFSLNGDTGAEDPHWQVSTSWLQGGSDTEIRNTSRDVPGTIDPRSCIDLAAVCAGVGFSQASVSLADIPLLAHWNLSECMQRFQQDASFFIDRVNEADSKSALRDAWSEACLHFETRTNNECRVLDSIRRVDPEATESVEWDTVQSLHDLLKETGTTYRQTIEHHVKARTAQLGFEIDWGQETPRDNGDQRIPERIGHVEGLITLLSTPVSEWSSPVRQSPRTSLPFTLSWWLADGKRTIGDIDRLLRLEQIRFRECLPAWFTFLEKNNYVRFIDPPGDDEPGGTDSSTMETEETTIAQTEPDQSSTD